MVLSIFVEKSNILYELDFEKGQGYSSCSNFKFGFTKHFWIHFFFWPYMNTFLYIKSLMFIFLIKRNKNKNLIVMFACIFIYRSVWWCVHVHRTPRLSIIFIWSVTYINNLTINIWHLSFVDSIGEKVEFLIVTLVKLGKDNI